MCVRVGEEDYVVGVDATLEFDPCLARALDDSFIFSPDEQATEHLHGQDEQQR